MLKEQYLHLKYGGAEVESYIKFKYPSRFNVWLSVYTQKRLFRRPEIRHNSD